MRAEGESTIRKSRLFKRAKLKGEKKGKRKRKRKWSNEVKKRRNSKFEKWIKKEKKKVNPFCAPFKTEN